MSTETLRFDEVLETARRILRPRRDELPDGTLLNVDLSSRVRLVVPSRGEADEAADSTVEGVGAELARALSPHAYPAERMVLWEEDIKLAHRGTHVFPLFDDSDRVLVADRLIHGASWSLIDPVSDGAPRIVFFSLKGGVGRSTALAASAWHLSAQGRRVMVMDLDLESPGISTFLLPADRQPSAGVIDWLVEDLVDHGDDVVRDLYALAPEAPGAEITVIPAHGAHPGAYISKLGRAWMAKGGGAAQERWEQRLRRLLEQLEEEHRPDVVLIDSRSGLDDVASNAIASLGADTTLLFATDDQQTWQGYGSLFRHWRGTGVAQDIRERLHVVAALVPEEGAVEHVKRVRDEALNLFESELYDEVGGKLTTGEDDAFSFARDDDFAPHYPWTVRWNRGLVSLRSLSSSFGGMDDTGIDHVFGPLLDGMDDLLGPLDETGRVF